MPSHPTPAPPPLPSLHSRRYRQLLLLAAAVGVPVPAVAFAYPQLVHHLQHWVYHDLPAALGLDPVPLIALGAGLAAWAPSLVKRGDDEQDVAVLGAAGAFAAISLLLG